MSRTTPTIALAALLAACASAPPTRHHTLLPPPDAAGAPAASSVPWLLLPVGVPAQVDRPQWVVRAPDGSLTVLEQERWIAPLTDEFGAALAGHLSRRVGPPAGPGDAKAWRVAVDVQRFDAVPGRGVRLDAVWSLQGDATLRCAARLEHAAGADALALAAAHRRSVAQLGEQIAAALAALAAGRGAACEAPA